MTSRFRTSRPMTSFRTSSTWSVNSSRLPELTMTTSANFSLFLIKEVDYRSVPDILLLIILAVIDLIARWKKNKKRKSFFFVFIEAEKQKQQSDNRGNRYTKFPSIITSVVLLFMYCIAREKSDEKNLYVYIYIYCIFEVNTYILFIMCFFFFHIYFFWPDWWTKKRLHVKELIY